MKSDSSKFREYLVAGGTSGAVARTCIAPIERVKIIFQIQRNTHTVAMPATVGGPAMRTTSGFSHLPSLIIKNEGILALWKGNSAAVARVFPYQAINFMAFEEYRILMNKAGLVPVLGKSPVDLIAGSLGGLTGVICTYPLDLVRARLAMQSEGHATPKYRGVIHALWTIPKESGFKTLYRGMSASLVGGAPYNGLKFASYEAMKTLMLDYFNVIEPTTAMRLSCGAFAGMLAESFVYPLDVMRRRMQTEGLVEGRPRYSGLWSGLRTIAREEGIRRGLFRGLSLNYLKTVPNVAITFCIYDYIKLHLLGY